jgi:hypothetical protein
MVARADESTYKGNEMVNANETPRRTSNATAAMFKN